MKLNFFFFFFKENNLQSHIVGEGPSQVQKRRSLRWSSCPPFDFLAVSDQVLLYVGSFLFRGTQRKASAGPEFENKYF